MNEHGFVKAVHRHLSDDVFRWKIHDKFAGGVPDAMYVGPAGVLFVEYKYLKDFPKRPTTPLKINVSPLQIAWMQEVSSRSSTNVACVVVIGCANNALIVSIEDLSNTISSKEAQLKCVAFADIARYIEETIRDGFANTRSKPAEIMGKQETQF